MSRDRESYGTILRVLRVGMRFFAGFLLFIVAVVAWRKLWVEELGLLQLQRGELVSLGLLVFLALVLIAIASRVQKEIDRNQA